MKSEDASSNLTESWAQYRKSGGKPDFYMLFGCADGWPLDQRPRMAGNGVFGRRSNVPSPDGFGVLHAPKCVLRKASDILMRPDPSSEE